MTALLPILALILSPVETDDLGWVVNIGVFDREELADPLAMELDSIVTSFVSLLRVPDWTSLAEEYKGWMVYSGPYETGDEASTAACEFLYRYPDVSAVWVGNGPPREERLPEAMEFIDLYGLMPPSAIFYETGFIQPGWRIERNYPDVGEVEEWQQPELITITLPGWQTKKCLDLYVGSLETRAYRTGNDPEEHYRFASEFLKSNADAVGAVVFEDAGRYTSVHRLPDPEDREGDRDLWVAFSGDTLEYGSRIRLFFGEMPYSWPYVPEGVRTSIVPDIVTSPEEAIEFLMGVLSWSGAYTGQFPEGYSFGTAWMDNLPDDVYRDYFDIAIREVHVPGGSGDPNISPVIDRFRVYRRGEVIWWHPLYGEFVPFEECLENLFPE
jgi:hypothetical protein